MKCAEVQLAPSLHQQVGCEWNKASGSGVHSAKPPLTPRQGWRSLQWAPIHYLTSSTVITSVSCFNVLLQAPWPVHCILMAASNRQELAVRWGHSRLC